MAAKQKHDLEKILVFQIRKIKNRIDLALDQSDELEEIIKVNGSLPILKSLRNNIEKEAEKSINEQLDGLEFELARFRYNKNKKQLPA